MTHFSKSFLFCSAISIFLISTSACSHQGAPGGGKPGIMYPPNSVVIPIDGPSNGKCALVGEVNVAQAEQVVWLAQGTTDLTIMFSASSPPPPGATCTPGSGSPFVDGNSNAVYLFPVHQGSSKASGQPKTTGCFKYAVAPTYLSSDPTKPLPIPGTACADPNVIVR